MGTVLTTNAIISCGHPPGRVKPLDGEGVLTVGGVPVLLMTHLTDSPLIARIEGCGQPPPPPCTQIATVTAGASSVLTVRGVAVVLDTLAGTTDKPGTLAILDTGQTTTTLTAK